MEQLLWLQKQLHVKTSPATFFFDLVCWRSLETPVLSFFSPNKFATATVWAFNSHGTVPILWAWSTFIYRYPARVQSSACNYVTPFIASGRSHICMAFYGIFFGHTCIWRPIDGSQLVLLHLPPFNCHLAPGVHNEGREGEGEGVQSRKFPCCTY